MKICAKCGLEKSLDSFNKSSKNKDGKHSYCRDCQKGHYQDNKETHIKNVNKRKQIYRQEALDLIVANMTGGCVDCGNTDIRVIEFDHVRGEKVNGIGQLLRLGVNLDKLTAELDKCEPRCKNCHVIKTYERLGATWHDTYMPL